MDAARAGRTGDALNRSLSANLLIAYRGDASSAVVTIVVARSAAVPAHALGACARCTTDGGAAIATCAAIVWIRCHVGARSATKRRAGIAGKPALTRGARWVPIRDSRTNRARVAAVVRVG